MRHAPLAPFAACAVLAACSSNSSDFATPTQQLLYVGDDGLPANLRAYALPLTSTSVPVDTLPMNKPFLLGLNTTTLAVTGLNGNIQLFALPLASFSTPFAVITSASNGTPSFGAAGLLYQGAAGGINVYTPPFSNATVPSSNIPTFGLSPAIVAIDPGGTIYATAGDNSIGVVTGRSLTTTLTASTAMAFRGMVATTTRLFVCGFNGLADDVFIYALPLTASATPAITIDLGDAAPEACVLDASGQLYVGSPDGRILVFAPPFTDASMPTLILKTPSVIYGMAVGP